MRELKIGIIQQQNIADTNDNMRRISDNIERLAHAGAQLVVLQELQFTILLSGRGRK